MMNMDHRAELLAQLRALREGQLRAEKEEERKAISAQAKSNSTNLCAANSIIAQTLKENANNENQEEDNTTSTSVSTAYGERYAGGEASTNRGVAAANAHSHTRLDTTRAFLARAQCYLKDKANILRATTASKIRPSREAMLQTAMNEHMRHRRRVAKATLIQRRDAAKAAKTAAYRDSLIKAMREETEAAEMDDAAAMENDAACDAVRGIGKIRGGNKMNGPPPPSPSTTAASPHAASTHTHHGLLEAATDSADMFW